MALLLPRFLLLALLALLLLPVLGRAQEPGITGHVIDAATKEPVPFTSIGLKASGLGGLTDEYGYFQLVGTGQYSNDSLILATVGYDRRVLFIERGKAQNLQIELTQHVLSPVELAKARQNQTRQDNRQDHLRKVSDDSVKNGSMMGIGGTEYAFFLKNETPNKRSTIRALSFYSQTNRI